MIDHLVCNNEIVPNNDCGTINNYSNNSSTNYSSDYSFSRNGEVLNEYNEEDLNNYLLNVDINSLPYEDYNSENYVNEKMCKNEYLDIDLENLIFSRDAEKYIKFLSNVKIYFLKKLDDIDYFNTNCKDRSSITISSVVCVWI